MSRVLRITDANTRKISNAVFDNWTSGVPDNWTATGSPTTAQTISEGTIQTFASAYALDIRNASTQAIRGYYQDITDVNSGQTYYISVYVKPTTGNVRLYAWDGGGTSNAVFVESSGTEWQQLIVEKTAVSTGIRIGLIAFDAGSQAVFDLVQLATFNIEFIEGVYSSFFRVTNWEVQVPDYKGSGVFSSSPVAEGRKLIDGYWDNVVQTITFHLRGDGDTDITTQNAAAEKLSELFNALQAARDFSKTSWVRDPVYMQYKADNETNYRYAFIANARIPQLSDQYNIEFAQLVMLDLDLIIEHPVAFGMPPGEGAPVLSGVRTAFNNQDYGQYDSSGNEYDIAEWVEFTNRHTLANISNMHLGTGGANLIGGSLPRNVAASNTTSYFGINTSLTDAGPFMHLVFHVSRAAVGSVTGDWQYYDSGGGWTSLGTLADIDTSNGFTETGIHYVTFRFSQNWTTLSPGGSLPTGYWVRYVATGTYSTVPQIDREVYTPTRNYLEFPADAIGGNISALIDIEARSIVGSPIWIDRLVGGLWSVERGADFQSIINLGGEQNHSDIAITYDSGVSAVSNPTDEWSTGVVARSTAASEKYVDITISGDLAQQYIGEFRCFATIFKDSAATVSVRVSYKSLPGMPFEDNRSAQYGTLSTDYLNAYDLGLITIDPESLGGRYPEEILIRLYTDADTTDNLDRHYLVLIPVDEYQFDTALQTLYTGNDSRWDKYTSEVAIIGSANFQKAMNRTNFVIVNESNHNDVNVRFVTRANGPMILHNNSQQRLYFFPMYSTTTQGAWACRTSALVSCRLHHNPRYLGMRGSQ